MSRKVVIWLAVSNSIFLMVMTWLLMSSVIPVRPTAALVLPFLLVVNYAIYFSTRSSSKRDTSSPRRLSALVWIVVGIYAIEAVGALVRFAFQPGQVTAGVAAASLAIGALGWWVIYRAGTDPQKRFLEAIGFGAAAIGFGVFWLAAAELDANPQPAWLVYGYLLGLVGSTALAAWRLMLFFRT